MSSALKQLLKVRRIYSQEQIAEFLDKDIRTIRRWEKKEVKLPKVAMSALGEMLRGSAFHAEEEQTAYNLKPKFTFIDLFAGIGGTRLGFEKAGGKCVFTSEWDKYSCQTYRANHEDDHEINGDITRISESAIPDHDVLVAGFPCQPFSLAGVSKKQSMGRAHGFLDETQGTLFFDIARILARKKPKAFLLENVKNLRSHDRGRTFEVILKTLREELGYTVYDQVVDGKCLVPQHRERIYIVGFKNGEEFDFDALGFPEVTDGPTLEKILHSKLEGPEPEFTIRARGRTIVNPKYTLSDKLWSYLVAYAEKHREKGNGFGCSVVGPKDTARTLSARYHSQGRRKNPRRLTPRECARLMGFPESFRIPVSDTQAYRQFGNSVVVPVVERLAKGIEASLAGQPIRIDGNKFQLSLPGMVAEKDRVYATA